MFEFHLHIKNYQSYEFMMNLLPWFVSGFVDGEGTFAINIRKGSRYRLGWSVEPAFSIGLHPKDEEILIHIREYFGGGGIGTIHKNTRMVSCPASLQGRVHSLEQISNIIIHFDRYPLITNKHADYLLFKEVIQMLLKKEHLTQEGLQAIVNIRGALNKGQTPLLKEAFPNSVAVPRPLVKLASTLPDPNWLAGFTAGEGCFLVNLRKSSSHKFGMRVMLRFKLTQHTRDEQLLKSI